MTESKAERGVVHEGSLGSGQYQQGVVLLFLSPTNLAAKHV